MDNPTKEELSELVANTLDAAIRAAKLAVDYELPVDFGLHPVIQAIYNAPKPPRFEEPSNE